MGRFPERLGRPGVKWYCEMGSFRRFFLRGVIVMALLGEATERRSDGATKGAGEGAQTRVEVTERRRGSVSVRGRATEGVGEGA